jgi:glycosyltransferase involved in cell wall biosynthesis
VTSGTYRIAVLLPGVGVFGGVRRFLEVGNELVRRGHDVTVYHASGEPPDWMPFLGRVEPLQSLEGSRHDVILCNDPPLFHRYGGVPAKLRIFYFAAERIPDERRIVRSGWTLVANSESMFRYLRRRYGVQAQRAVGGINLEVFRPLAVERDPQEFRVLCFGRRSRRSKGVDLVRRAVEGFAARLPRKRCDAQRVKLVLFDHVGAGNERDPREGFESTVPCEWHLNRPQEELASLYSSCDVFVNAERKAGWTNTVAEAMACGVPVVCTRSGTLDLARHRETAWVVPLRHPWFLRRGLRALYENPQMVAAMREAARQGVQRFSWKGVTDQLLGVIHGSMPKGAPEGEPRPS